MHVYASYDALSGHLLFHSLCLVSSVVRAMCFCFIYVFLFSPCEQRGGARGGGEGTTRLLLVVIFSLFKTPRAGFATV